MRRQAPGPLLRLAIRVRREQAELVLAELLELAPSGVEEVQRGETVEYAIYGSPGELPALPALKAAAAGALVELHTTELPDGWSERWREFHKPLVLGDRMTVRPPWAPQPSRGIDLVIDPGQAFGTGAHATTRLCLELMLELPGHEGGFVDLGCGSGVLAIAAAKLGWQPVLALDNDPACIEAACLNARVNRAAVDVRRLDLRPEPVPGARTIAANLLGPLLIDWAPRVPAEAEQLILSGLLAEEADQVEAAFASWAGTQESIRRCRGEWAALLLERH